MKIGIISDLGYPVKPSYNQACPVNEQIHWLIPQLAEKHDVSVMAKAGSSGYDKFIEYNLPNEKAIFDQYKDNLNAFDAIVDFSNDKWTTTVKEEKKLNIVYVCYPTTQGYSSPPPLRRPCFVGVSHGHSMALSEKLGIAVKTLPFGVPLVPEVPRKDYLLFFGRVVRERGAHELVALARKRNIPAVVAGDDIYVDQPYVQRILQSCDGTLIKYYGAVSSQTRNTLIAEAKALVIPYLSDNDAHSLLTVKMAIRAGTPVFTIDKGSTWDMPDVAEFLNLEELYDADFDVKHPLPPGESDLFTIEGTARKLETLIKEAIDSPW